MILINGQPADTIPIADRGFQYGDGVFETLAVERGAPLCLTAHLKRLTCGCQRLAILAPDSVLLREEIKAVTASLDRGVLKIIITRGSGGRGYAPMVTGPATRIVAGLNGSGHPLEYREQGIEAFLCRMRLARNPALAGIKHLNRLEQVLGRGECQTRGIPEGIMMDTEGNLIEGTMSNLFLVRGQELITPDLFHSGIRGIVRDRIIKLARAGGRFRVRESVFGASALEEADEVFFCNSLIGIWPVRRYRTITFSLGPATRYLQEALIGQAAILSEAPPQADKT
uniref:Aminodeoxychorismate lyase n=1 Tax=Candidatus Kentrum sp. DK TaxID=2126562 RepID=A0A450SE31_9GAMM|nr:MAG: aminodeoxychorismate lyase apoprotein [Candidatus Kentron sp. DK]